ncbi:MAG TPA: HAMP domain-containing sensor histidine kinase [Gaiellaceae bacterium]|nr:HAMP domain-containing sensor histidine kinase [Gaiellaceae bacterium]
MSTRLVATLLVLGALGIGATALFVDGSAGDALVLAAEAGGASVAVGLIVGLVLWALRRSSIASQLVVITLGTVGAVAAGALVSAQTMFAAERPYAALALVLVTSGTASVLIGLSLSARVRRESDSLARAARTLGTSAPALVFDRPETDELARLARELDLSARRLDESRAYAAQLDRSRRELVAWISHDLRTPLARIRAMVEALDDRVVTDSDEVTSFHERLRGDAGRLTGLVDELFELSRIDAGALTLDFQELELADLVGDLVAAFVPVAEGRGIRLRAELHAQPVVRASMDHIERAISNLLDNAIRYSREASVVSIDMGERDAEAYVAISDGCGGVSREELAGIFDVASLRRHAGTGDGGRSTGLGLAIAKGLIDAHGGTLSVEDANGGCRFTVALPIATATPTGRAPSPLPSAP